MQAASIARFLAGIINPALCILLLAACLIRRNRRGWLPFAGLCALGIALPTTLAEWAKAHAVWHGDPSFPSGHETFALSAVTCLCFTGARWALVCGPALAAVMAWSLVTARYHTAG
jgi:membrane-associated phospholipid phosphatase